MASVVEATGKSVADALSSALRQLGCTEDEVDYEVLEAPSKGFLGLFGVKPAKIKVTKKETAVQTAAPVEQEPAAAEPVGAEPEAVAVETPAKEKVAGVSAEDACGRAGSACGKAGR